MPYTTNIDKHGAPMLVGPQCNCIACPCIKKALDTNPKGWIFIFKSVFFFFIFLMKFHACNQQTDLTQLLYSFHDKRGQIDPKGPTPKLVTVLFYIIFVCSFSLQFLEKFLSEMLRQICCSFCYFRDMKEPKFFDLFLVLS